MPMKNPPHPGRIVRDDCLTELNLTTGQAAEALGVTRQTLDRIINETQQRHPGYGDPLRESVRIERRDLAPYPACL